MEPDLSVGGFGLEIRGHSAYLESHGATSYVIKVTGEFVFASIAPGGLWVNRSRKIRKILSRNGELLAPSFVNPPVRQKNHSDRKSPGYPDIAFYRAGPAAIQRTPTNDTATNRQPSKKLATRVSTR